MTQTTAPADQKALAIGQPLEGGFLAGQIVIAGQRYALIVAPRAEGERDETRWIDDYKDVPGAKSYDDGAANTQAMAEAGSALAQWARSLTIGGFSDWHLPSQDELEICYRNLKPSTETNSCYARSGINLSTPAPTRPYTPEHPAQTSADAFRAGGDEAFSEDWYWSSTQHAATSYDAWYQVFDYGGQSYDGKSAKLRARAVRRLPL